MSPCVVGFVTCGSKAEARRVAKALLAKRLAACVNILDGVESHYRWQGKVQQGHEKLLLVKTTQARTKQVISCVREVHGYDVPEIIFMPIMKGETNYLRWLRGAVRLLVLAVGLCWVGVGALRADEVDELAAKLGAGDPEVRAEAADQLTALGGPRVEGLFREMLASTNPERRQLAAVGLLQVNDTDENLQAVRPLLADNNSIVRWSAVLALGESGRVLALPWVQEAASQDSSVSVREAAAEAVTKLQAVIPWSRSLAKGLEEAGRRNQPVLVYFHLRGSDYCRRFDRGVLRDAEVVDAAQRFVPVWIDAGVDMDTVQRRDIRGTPTVLVLDERGQEMLRVAGLVDKAQFLDRLEESRRGGLTFREARRLASRQPTHLAANWKLAETYLGDGREELAEPYLRNVVDHDPENHSGYADNALFALGFVLGKKKEYAKGAFCLQELLQRYPGFKDRDKALYCLGLCQLALGERLVARETLEQLTREFPASGAAAGAAQALERLEGDEQN